MVKRFLLLLGGAATAIVSLEFFVGQVPSAQLLHYLRFADPDYYPKALYRPSKATGFEYIPGSSSRINSLGMVDREYAMEKPPETYRILVLGDSIAVPNLYPAMLEDYLNLRADDQRFEVLNAGLPGIGVRQYAGYLREKGLRLSPDMVLVGLELTDFEVWAPVVYRGEKGGGDILYEGYPGSLLREVNLPFGGDISAPETSARI